MKNPIEHIHEKLGKGLDAISNHQLKLVAELMSQGMSFDAAASTAGLDPSSIDTPTFADIFDALPPGLQAKFADGSAALPPAVHEAVFGTPPTSSDAFAGSPTATSASTTSVGVVTNPAGHAPPGLNKPDASIPPPMDLGARILPPGSAQNAVQAVANAPSALIQRVFSGEGARVETPHNQSTTPNTNAGGPLRSDAAQVVAMPRNANGQAHRAEHAQQHQMPGHHPQLKDPVHNAANTVHARNDGRGPSALQPGNAQGNPHVQQAMAQAPAHAAPQGASQAAGFAAQQSAAQAAPQQAGNRQMGEQPGQQVLNPRAADAVGSQRVPDARPALAAPDARGYTPQQPLPAQAVQPAQARPEIMAAQVMPQLVGLTVVANPQLAAINGQLNQNATPVAPGAENSASQARDALLAPAGHTLAGFLRRDHRGRAQLLRKPVDWMLALMPGTRKRKVEGEAEATSFQWLFWILTVAAYGAIATAIVTMAPTGGSLLDERGHPSTGAYALVVGAIAAIASWLVGRRLAKPNSPKA